MLTKIQARLVAFFKRPAVQSVVRHAVTAAVAVGIAAFMAGGWPAVVTSVTAVAILRAVWAVVSPAVVPEVIQVAEDGTGPQAAVQAPAQPGTPA